MKKKGCFWGLLISIGLFLTTILLRNLLGVITSWIAGPASLIWFLTIFDSELFYNITSSILFIVYYSLIISNIYKYYHQGRRIRVAVLALMILVINTISFVMLSKYLIR